MNFQLAQQIRYDPKQIISNRRLKNKNGPFEHQEIEGLRALANLEDVQQDQQLTATSGKMQESQGATRQTNPLTMQIETPHEK